MSEEKPVFKIFKKPTSRKIGDFDVNDKSEWTLMIHRNHTDLPDFIHFHKLWNVEETADELDSDGNIVTKGVKARPIWIQTEGFIKDGKFVSIKSRTVNGSGFQSIYEKYIALLKTLIDNGYEKDVSNYDGKTPVIPVYHTNEQYTRELRPLKDLFKKI